ncbi:MAG: aldo/keto reductase [Acidimicrobiia bacterium]|nr:aldo/keto reductase [Acidimicrobiia bacterium]MDH5521664.1 aldo/keto reductase [Acidimicrobiia bacterium]
MTDMPHSPFGATNHRSSRVIFGAAALGSMRQDRADETLRMALDAGVNHIDTAADYGDSEIRLAPFLAEHRAGVFLATKTGDRSGTEARASLERSLERMGVDQVDLIQLHNLVEEDEWQTAFAPGGALEALVAARDEGLCRFIGVTGHGTRICAMHLRSLAEYPFDSVLFPYNPSMLSIDEYRSDCERLRAVCAERNVAVQTIKSIARRRWADESAPHRSWYEPLTDPAAIERAVRFVLNEDDLFLNTTSDATLHRLVYEATFSWARNPGAPTAEELAADTAEFEIHPLFDGRELEVI